MFVTLVTLPGSATFAAGQHPTRAEAFTHVHELESRFDDAALPDYVIAVHGPAGICLRTRRGLLAHDTDVAAAQALASVAVA